MSTKNAQHTPGPWHLSECAGQTTDAGICAESGLHITDVGGYGMRDDQNEANARLIAAAPELLAALECLVAVGNPSADPLVMFAATEKARAAIAKALGQP